MVGLRFPAPVCNCFIHNNMFSINYCLFISLVPSPLYMKSEKRCGQMHAVPALQRNARVLDGS